MNLFYGLSKYMRRCEVCKFAPRTKECEIVVQDIDMCIQPYYISQQQLGEVTNISPVQSEPDFTIFVREIDMEVDEIDVTHLIRYRKKRGKLYRPPFFGENPDHENRIFPIQSHNDDGTTTFSESTMQDDSGNDVIIPKLTDIRNLVVRRVVDSIPGYIEIWAKSHSVGDIGDPPAGENIPHGERGRLI